MLFCPSKYSCPGHNSVTAGRILFNIVHVGPPGGVDVPFVGCDTFDPEKLEPLGVKVICLFTQVNILVRAITL